MSTTFGLKPDHKYQGRVRDGSVLIETLTGTLGFQVMLTCDDGRCFYTIWLTPKNKERAMKDFETLGVPAEKLQDPSYIEYQLGLDIAGREITFGSREEEYKGKTTVKVAWIGKPSLAADGNKAAAVARFFGAAGAAPNASSGGPVTEDNPITDDDIPF